MELSFVKSFCILTSRMFHYFWTHLVTDCSVQFKHCEDSHCCIHRGARHGLAPVKIVLQVIFFFFFAFVPCLLIHQSAIKGVPARPAYWTATYRE